jgi:DNA-binding PadR family transcriptional regulator
MAEDIMRVATWEKEILGLLIEQGPSYGLALVEASRGRLTRGGIYVALGRMEEKGLVTSKEAEGGRRMYRVTALGERALLAARLFAGEVRLGGTR